MYSEKEVSVDPGRERKFIVGLRSGVDEERNMLYLYPPKVTFTSNSALSKRRLHPNLRSGGSTV